MFDWLLKLLGLSKEIAKPVAQSLGQKSQVDAKLLDLNQFKVLPNWYLQKKSVFAELSEIMEIGSDDISILGQSQEWKMQIRADIERLAPKPSSSFELFRKISDPLTSPKELASIASKDPMLASRILKTVNSAMYGLHTTVTSLGRAIILLGSNNLKTIALLHSNDSDSSRTTPEENNIWKHSIVVSTIAHHIAEKVHGLDENELSTLGLLHDLGKILRLNKSFSENAASLENIPSHYSSQNQDAVLGAQLARNWGVPESLCLILEQHAIVRDFGLGGLPYDVRRSALVLYLADFTANYFGFSDSDELRRPTHEVLQFLGLGDDIESWFDQKGVKDVETALLIFGS